jgi:hypothetical protein
MRTLLIVVLFGLLLAGPLATQAEDQPQANAIDEAKEMVAAAHLLTTMDAALGLISQSIEGLIERANPGHEKEVSDFMSKYYLPEIRKRLPELGDLMAEEYARYFTAEELGQLVAFYKSDIGQKLVALQPKMMQDAMQLGRAWGGKVAIEVLRKVEPELEKQGLKSPNI